MIIIEVLKLKPIGFLSPFLQIAIICGLLTLAVLTQRKEYEKSGKTYGRYPWRVSTFLSSIYEEIIFRGFVLFGLLMVLSPLWSIIISSTLFGLWHIKNLKWQTSNETIYQVAYTAIVFGPIASIITLWTGTIWLAVIVHYLHNLLVDAYRTVRPSNRFMLFSNLFLILPVIFAAIYHQWLYCFFASGIFVFSPLFHWYRILNVKSFLFRLFKTFDWMFAVSAFLYMYYYIYSYTDGSIKLTLFTLLSLVVLFFWYGWKRADYEKYHPWFHIIAPIVSSAILVLAHLQMVS